MSKIPRNEKTLTEEERAKFPPLPKLKLEDNPNFIIFEPLSKAYGMPKETEEEKAENKEVWGEDNITLI